LTQLVEYIRPSGVQKPVGGAGRMG
jgi:hypothetical protein